MKKIIAVFSVVLCFVAVFAGCKKVDRNATSTTTQTTVAAMTMPEVESSYDKDTKTMKSVYRDLNGNIAEIRETVYNENKQIEKECIYDADENLISYSTIKYDDNSNILEQSFYNGKNELQTIQKHVYNDKGERIAIETYSPEGNLIAKNEF